MKDYSSIKEIEDLLCEITGSSHGISSIDFLVPTESQNAFLVHELNGEADLAVCLKNDVLNQLNERKTHGEFKIEDLSLLSIVVEELSHFNYYCEKALRNLSISPLELEVQAEVDKFAFALNCLEQKNEDQFRDEIFSIMFDEFKLGEWVKEEEKGRYEAAHHIARSFCRKMLSETASRKSDRDWFRAFYRLDSSQKTKV